MNLCIDIGNTRIKIGVFDKGQMIHNDAFNSMTEKEVDALLRKFKIEKAISCSTRKRISAFEKIIKSKINLLRLSHKTAIPIVNKYQTPETLGKDRLAAVIGCTKVYPKKSCLVIDAGTCITYDLIDSEGNYHGGNISPGLRMRAQAMDTMTSALPLIEPKYNADYIGKSTETAMQNGIVYGTLLEMQSFIAMIKENIGEINVIITGGDAPFFEDILNSKIFVHSFLVLEGLDVIINYNAI
jgi:type III pantothenate kinase